MKKYLLFLLLAITLVLGACSNTKETTSMTKNVDEVVEEAESETLSTGTEVSEKLDASNQNESKGTVQEENTDVSDYFDIKLNTESKTIELQYSEEKAVVLADSSPSEPLKSPNGKKAAYISPWGWEELSDLYLVDLHDGSQDILVAFNPEEQPKDFIWEDDEHVLVIIGYPYGTISVGGGIYRVNVETYEKEHVVTDTDYNTQITDLLRIEDGVLYYSGIQYTDETQNEYKDISNQITLETE